MSKRAALESGSTTLEDTMYLLQAALPPHWAILAWILLLPLTVHSLIRLRSGEALQGAQQHLWLAGAVLLAWLWTLQARVAGGAAFGLLGVAFYSLIFGCHWARLGLLAAVALHTVLGGGSWMNFGINGLLLAVVPTLLASVLQKQVEQRLPKNVFIFMIGHGMFVTLAVTVATSALLVAVSWLLRPGPADLDQLAYALLLAWGEALASGMLFSALVIFGPHLVLTYRQDLYLPPRRVL
jgi:uncharacterized membrane protein